MDNLWAISIFLVTDPRISFVEIRIFKSFSIMKTRPNGCLTIFASISTQYGCIRLTWKVERFSKSRSK